MELFELNPKPIELHLKVPKSGTLFPVKHELRRPTQDDWIAYDKGLSVAIEDTDDGGTRTLDNSLEAACALWDRLAQSIAGYLPDGEGLPEGWRQRVPPAHKRGAVRLLCDVVATPDVQGGLLLAVDEEVVVLMARREQTFPRLVHRFRPPTPGQRIHYDRLSSDSYVIRGRKSGKDCIVFPSRMQALCKLYDELIVSVEGYAVDDRPITEGKDAVSWMDAQHKRHAVQWLFRSDAVEIAEPTEGEGE